MHWLNLLLISVVVSIASACGRAEVPSQSTDATEPPPAAMGQGATPEMVGGGKTTEIHPGDGGSPHVMTEWMVGEANISITYGRPYLKGRVIGESVEPMIGKVWRRGGRRGDNA